MELIWFIAGVLFALVIMPLLETFTSYLMTCIDSKKIKHTEAINDGNIRMQKAASSVDEYPTRQIGFVLSEEEELEEDEEI